MARSRRGSFGLQPRVVPNVTGQIVALAREYQAKRDANIMDAWRNGGTFEGKKATDDMVLAYWKERQSGLEEGDPNYEAAKNQVEQLTYAVEQSKMDVLHLQNKISDQQYAQFFLKWANKVPKNSEFYRTLQKDAAQLIESSKAKARANADRVKTEQFNNFVKGTTAQDIAIGDAMTQDLTNLSKATGLSITGNGDELLKMLTDDVKANPDAHKLLLDTIRKGDPHWNGELTEGYFTTHIKQATQGYEKIADRAQKDGFVSAYANATQGMASMAGWGQNLKVWPVAESYSTFENVWQKVMQDPNASQMDKIAASNAFAGQLDTLGKTQGIDAGSASMIAADAARLRGQDGGDSPTFGQAMLGRPGVDPQTSMQLGAWQATAAEMTANPLAWSYGPVDKNGNYDPTGQGPLGMVPAGQVPPGAVGVMVPGANGQAVLAMVSPHSVYTSDPNDPNASPRLAGYQVSYNVGGKNIQLWNYRDDQGKVQWTDKSPVAQGATTQYDNKGDVYVTPAASTAMPIDQQIASLKDPSGNPIQLTEEQKTALINGGSITTHATTVAKGKAGETQSITMSVKGGYLQSSVVHSQVDAKGNVVSSTTTPIQNTATTPAGNAFSPSTMAAGDIPGVTFSSPLAASVNASKYTQTDDQVSKFASDPAFQQQFLSQTMQALGTDNPYDPRIAEAWKGVTTVNGRAQAAQDMESFKGKPIPAALRADLRYPGPDYQSQSALGSKLNINYGNGQTLQIPGLPSYMKDLTIGGPGGGGSAAGWLSSSPIGSLLPGLGLNIPSQMPTPSPTTTPKPVTASPTATPMPGGLPQPTPTAPAPSAPPPNLMDGKAEWNYEHGK